MTALVQEILAWMCIGFGLFTLTEGYHALRQRAAKTERPARYWWVAGIIYAAGLALIMLGLRLDGY